MTHPQQRNVFSELWSRVIFIFLLFGFSFSFMGWFYFNIIQAALMTHAVTEILDREQTLVTHKFC